MAGAACGGPLRSPYTDLETALSAAAGSITSKSAPRTAIGRSPAPSPGRFPRHAHRAGGGICHPRSLRSAANTSGDTDETVNKSGCWPPWKAGLKVIPLRGETLSQREEGKTRRFFPPGHSGLSGVTASALQHHCRL